MLVEFRVKNFRSIKNEQVLSLVASSDKTIRDTHVYETGLRAVPGVLRSAVVYGANASGKSNLIKALQYVRAIVMESATIIQPGQTYNVQSFRLNEDSANQPSEFEITFLLNNVRHQYGFSITQNRIVAEHLLVYTNAKPQRWFNRYFNEKTNKDVFEYKTGLTGPKQVWQEATRPNALFLSVATQLNSQILAPVFTWFTQNLVVFNEHERLDHGYTANVVSEGDGEDKIRNFLRSADISINEIKVEKRKIPGQEVNIDFVTGEAKLSAKEIDHYDIRFLHVTDSGRAFLSFEEESGGTRNLFALAGPILDILKKGKTLIVDELDISLHPLIVKDLVRLFHDPEVNINNAQLIFSTHDSSLLDAPGLFRRDQIWLTEKNHDQETELVALSDFSPRKNEAIERGYLSGRYGGIPFLEDSERLKL